MPTVPVINPRVQRDPLADQRSTSSISPEGAGAAMGNAFRQAGQQMDQLGDEAWKLAEKHQQEQDVSTAQKALKNVKELVGNRVIDYKKTPAGDVDDKAHKLFIADIDKIYTDGSKDLSPRAMKMYQQVVDHEQPARHVDAYEFKVKSEKIAQQDNRKAVRILSEADVIADPKSKAAAVSAKLADDSAIEPGMSEAERNLAILASRERRTAGAVDTLLKRNDLDGAAEYLTNAEKQGHVTGGTAETLRVAIKQKSIDRDDRLFEDKLMTELDASVPGNTLPAMNAKLQEGISRIEADVWSNALTDVDGQRRIQKLQARIARNAHFRRVDLDTEEKARVAKIDGAGTYETAQKALEGVSPELLPVLQARINSLYPLVAHDQGVGTGQKMPKPSTSYVEQVRAIISELIQKKSFTSVESVINTANAAHLPPDEQEYLAKFYKGGGDEINGLKRSDVIERYARINGKKPQDVPYKEGEDVFRYVSTRWDPKKLPSEGNIDEAVIARQWQGISLKTGQKMAAFEADAAGEILAPGPTYDQASWTEADIEKARLEAERLGQKTTRKVTTNVPGSPEMVLPGYAMVPGRVVPAVPGGTVTTEEKTFKVEDAMRMINTRLGRGYTVNGRAATFEEWQQDRRQQLDKTLTGLRTAEGDVAKSYVRSATAVDELAQLSKSFEYKGKIGESALLQQFDDMVSQDGADITHPPGWFYTVLSDTPGKTHETAWGDYLDAIEDVHPSRRVAWARTNAARILRQAVTNGR